MTTVEIDATYETFAAGQVLTRDSFGVLRAVKILKVVFVDEVEAYRYIVSMGFVVLNKFDAEVRDGKTALKLYSAEELRSVFTHKRTPGLDVKKGDILKDEKTGVLFLVETPFMVWNLNKGTHTTMENWESRYGMKLVMHKTTNGSRYSSKF